MGTFARPLAGDWESSRLLNILDPEHLRRLLILSRQLVVRLTHRYHPDVETAARTIWTGLHTARTNGFSAGKYGLMPMTLRRAGRCDRNDNRMDC